MADDKETEEVGLPPESDSWDSRHANRISARTASLCVQDRLAFDEDPPSYEMMYPSSSDDNNVPTLSNSKLDCGIVMSPRNLKENTKSQPNSNQIVPQTPPDTKVTSRPAIRHGDSKLKLTQGNEKPKPEKVLQRKITLTKLTETREKLMVQASGLTKGARETLREFCQKTTAHGFSHVVEKDIHIIMRIFWVIVTFVSLGALLSVGYDATYAAFVTKRPYTEVTYKNNQSTGIRLPDMTICTLSGFWKSKMEKYNVSKTLASYLLLAVRGTEVISPVLSRDPKRIILLKDELREYLEMHKVTLEELITMLSPDCEELVKGCYSSSQSLTSSLCCQTVLRPTITTLGVCFTTLSQNGLRLNQTIAGLVGGYRILFDVALHEYMDYDYNVVSTTSLAEAGIHVSLSNFASSPAVAANIQAVRIAPNTAASVALDVTNIDHTEVYLDDWLWPNPRPRCVSEEKFWAMSEEERAYTGSNQYFSLLYRDCLNHFFNCSAIPFMFTNDTTSACTPDITLYQSKINDKMMDCVQNHLSQLEEGFGKLCFTTTINQQLSYTTLMKNGVQNIIDNRLLPPNITLSMVNIYYTELGFTEYYERIPTFITWFSDLGGQMGLFMGASFITLVELIFTVCYVLRVLMTRGVKALMNKLRGNNT